MPRVLDLGRKQEAALWGSCGGRPGGAEHQWSLGAQAQDSERATWALREECLSHPWILVEVETWSPP